MADLNAIAIDGERPIDLADTEEMRQAIVNEEKRRRDHGFKRNVIPPIPTITAEQESNENDGEGQATATAVNNAEGEEEEADGDDEDDSSSSDEGEDN